MATVSELILGEEFGHLREIAEARNWPLSQVNKRTFKLTLTARDDARFSLLVSCSDYPQKPPAWHWCNPETDALDQKSDTPKGTGGYFDQSGCICAPWNRLAYQQENPEGPHPDWNLVNWRTNDWTKGCTTLSAMASRIAVELMSDRYRGREI